VTFLSQQGQDTVLVIASDREAVNVVFGGCRIPGRAALRPRRGDDLLVAWFGGDGFLGAPNAGDPESRLVTVRFQLPSQVR
jgi:hypothetical protein